MAKSIANINSELFLYKCSLSNLAIKYILKEITGQQNLACNYSKLEYGVLLIEAMSCAERILEQEILTQAQIEVELEKINNITGCVGCGDLNDYNYDTLPTGMEDIII